MKINDFINEYNSKSDREKEPFVKKHIITDYVPYEEKIAECKNIIKNSMYTADGAFNDNQTTRYMLFTLAVVKYYTDLEVNYDNVLEDFNLIERYGISDSLRELIEDYLRFVTVLNMMVDDVVAKETDLIGFINDKLNALQMLFELLADQEVKIDGQEETGF